MKNHHHILTTLMTWLEDNINMRSDLHFDNEGNINSEMVYNALAVQLTSLPPSDALKTHLTLSHSMLAQVTHLQHVHCPNQAWQSQFITLIERKTAGGLFVSPSTNPEPYREFHYYCDEHNTLWALLVMDIDGVIVEACLHPELHSDPEMFALGLISQTGALL